VKFKYVKHAKLWGVPSLYNNDTLCLLTNGVSLISRMLVVSALSYIMVHTLLVKCVY